MNNSKVEKSQMQPQEPKSAKKTYRSPALVSYGDIRELTRSSGMGPTGDNGPMTNNNQSGT